MEIARCRREIAAIEAELFAGNPDILGLLLAYADWHAELRIIQAQDQSISGRTAHAEDQSKSREIGGGDDTGRRNPLLRF
jgi:hypothetical protein